MGLRCFGQATVCILMCFMWAEFLQSPISKYIFRLENTGLATKVEISPSDSCQCLPLPIHFLFEVETWNIVGAWMHEIGLLRVIIKIYLNFQPWKKVFCRGLWSHNYNTVSTEQALDWQRLLSSETEHVRFRLSPVFFFFPAACLGGCKRWNLCFAGEL